MPIMWILYSYDEMMIESSFYQENYGIEGFVFADNGAGEPYVLKPDGTITCYNAIDDEEIQVADSLSDFYK